MKLYMILLGCRHEGRLIEQHDIFFDIGNSLPEMVAAIRSSWPQGEVHIDAWRLVTLANDYTVKIVERKDAPAINSVRLFFINLGGYKEGEFDEFHYKMVIAATDKGKAVEIAKQSAFYKQFKFPGASSHIDDKYGVDIDDLHDIEDILPADTKMKYAIVITPATTDTVEDELHLGYFNLNKVANGSIISS